MLKIASLLPKYFCIFSTCGASATFPLLYSTGKLPTRLGGQADRPRQLENIKQSEGPQQISSSASQFVSEISPNNFVETESLSASEISIAQQETHPEVKQKLEAFKKVVLDPESSQFSSSLASPIQHRRIKPEDRDQGIKDYREFIRNLMTVMKSGIPWYKPYEDLWIDKVFVTMPSGKFTDSSTLLKKKTETYAYLSPTFNGQLDNSRTTDVFDFDIHETFLNKNKPINHEWAALAEIRKMTNLLYTFLHKDWIGQTKQGEKDDLPNYDDLVLAHMELKDAKADPAEYGPDRTRHVLRFVRIYEGKYYYCDLYFNGQKGNALIRSHYMYYKDQSWRSGGYYQPNGSYASVRNHIGGDREAADRQWYTWTEIDESVSSIFKSFISNPGNTWMWFKILAESVKDGETSETFFAPYYRILPQLETSISREDSNEEEHYKRIHPLARKYHKIREEERRNFSSSRTSWVSLVTLDSLKEINQLSK